MQQQQGEHTMIFDAHFHVINPNFPLIENNGYLPDAFSIGDYREKVKDLNIAGGAVVSGSFQGFDQTYLRAALDLLGPTYVGVTQLPISTSDDEIIELDKAGVRAVRFNLFRGGSEDIKHIETMAKRIFDLAKWHIELYIDSQTLPEIQPILNRLPSYGIDHLGISKAGLKHLYKAVEGGAKVKATGFMRVDFEVAAVLKKINSINPGALMFGTDLPGTRASRQFALSDLALLHENFDENAVNNIVWNNAAKFYGLPGSV